MSHFISISPSERTVLRTMWEANEPLRASEVTSRLEELTGWRLTTVRTFLSRLAKKGAVTSRPDDSGVAVYEPAMREDDLLLLEGESVLNDYFDASPSDLMCRFIETGRVSDDELRAIRKMIDERIEKER